MNRNGRPAGRITPSRRKALAYVERRLAAGEPVIIGELVRQCGFCDRSRAKRVLRDLQKLGMLGVVR